MQVRDHREYLRSRGMPSLPKRRPPPALPCSLSDSPPNTTGLPEPRPARARESILQLAAAQRLPVVGVNNAFAEAGALLVYSAVASEVYDRAAAMTDSVLKGAKAADIPIEQPTKFDLVINMRTAKALGINVPPTILLQATRVIE